MKFFYGTCIVDYAFKFTANYFLLHIMNFFIIMNIYSTFWNIEDGNKQINKFTGQ